MSMRNAWQVGNWKNANEIGRLSFLYVQNEQEFKIYNISERTRQLWHTCLWGPNSEGAKVCGIQIAKEEAEEKWDLTAKAWWEPYNGTIEFS